MLNNATGTYLGSIKTNSQILVVDDECHIVRLIQVNLKRQGHRVISSFDPKSAITELEKNSFDVVVVDRHMPEVINEARRRGIQTIILELADDDNAPPRAGRNLSKATKVLKVLFGKEFA